MSNSAFTPTILQDFREASVSQSGIVTTGTQSFAGAKTFTTSTETPLGILSSTGSSATNARFINDNGPSTDRWVTFDFNSNGSFTLNCRNPSGGAIRRQLAVVDNLTGAWTIGDPTNTSFPGNNIVGRKDGSTVGAGYVGQVFSRVQVAAAQGFGGGAAAASVVTLTPGVWLVGGEMHSLGSSGESLFLSFYYDAAVQNPSAASYSNALAPPRVMVGPLFISLSANKNVTLHGNISAASNADAWVTAVRIA